MSATITDMLGSDSFSGSRVIINANFNSLKSELDDIESNFGLSITSGNIDVSAASGGEIKAKVGAFNSIQLAAAGTPKITLTGSTGAMVGVTLSLSTSLTVPAISVDNLTATALGQSIFNGNATFNSLTAVRDGFASNYIDIGTVTSHTVLNSDNVIWFSPDPLSPGTLFLTPDVALVDGHVVTLVDASNVSTTLDTTYILGFSSGSITFSAEAYKSCITLMYSLNDEKWFIIASSNVTII